MTVFVGTVAGSRNCDNKTAQQTTVFTVLAVVLYIYKLCLKFTCFKKVFK